MADRTAAAPLLALGMNSAPFNWPKRRQVRATMLRYEPVTSGRVVFRFVVGSTLVSRSEAPGALEGPGVAGSRWARSKARLERELSSHADLVSLDAIDGPGVAMECPAAEKTVLWMRHALPWCTSSIKKHNNVSKGDPRKWWLDLQRRLKISENSSNVSHFF